MPQSTFAACVCVLQRIAMYLQRRCFCTFGPAPACQSSPIHHISFDSMVLAQAQPDEWVACSYVALRILGLGADHPTCLNMRNWVSPLPLLESLSGSLGSLPTGNPSV